MYRNKIEPTKDIVAFFAFVSFFPQLVAGPIERATNLLPQFYRPRTFEYDKAVDGMRQILWGLFKKVVIADNCATYVNEVWAGYQDETGSTLALAAVLFAFQIYGDFSGYSDIAIGTARLFGINLMQNFNYPYLSRDIAEFWRRWHISLSTWFRDYLYIPLGGSRGGKWMSVRNTLIIFIVSGFWHGANWTFIAWGLYHGLLFLPLLLAGKNRMHVSDVVAQNRIFPTFKELIQMASTFALVVIGWIFFRAESIGDAFGYMRGMVQFGTLHSLYRFFTEINFSSLIVLLLFIEWIQRTRRFGFEVKSNNKIRYIMYILFVLLILYFGGAEEEFIYFQF